MDGSSHSSTQNGKTESRIDAHCAAVIFAGSGLLFVVALSLYLAAAPTFTNDFWFHLKMGEVYWLEGLWPDADPMLHTALASAPIQHEWLFGVLLHGLERTTGFFGIRVAHALAVLAIIGFGYAIARKTSANTLVACLIATAFAILAWTRLYQLRPDLLSIPATLVTCMLFMASYRVPTRREWFAFACMMLVWANSHSLFALAPLLLFAGLLGTGLRAGAEWYLFEAGDRRTALAATRRIALALILAIGISVFVSLLNPRGIEQHLTFFASSQDAAIWSVKDEWSHFDPWVASNNPGTVSPLLFGLMDGILIAFGLTSIAGIWAILRRRARALETFDPIAFGLSLASIVAIFVSVRFLWLAIFPMLFVGRALGSALVQSRMRSDSREIVCWILALATLGLGIQFYRVGGYQTTADRLPDSVAEYFSTPYLSRKFHVAGVQFLRDAEVEGRLFNSYGMGGFLGYWLSPKLSTYIDSRTEHYPPEVVTEYTRITRMRELGGRFSYLDTLDSREIDFFFGVGMPVGLVTRAGPSTTAHLEGMPNWVPVSRSLNHAIYLRDHSRNDENFAKIERYYAARGIAFDRHHGIDVAATVASNIDWALANDLLTPGQAQRITLRTSADPVERAAALEALAWVYTLGGSYSAAGGVERELAQLKRVSDSSLRRQVYSAMKLDRPEEANRAAAELVRKFPKEANARVVQQLAIAFAEVSRLTAGRMEVGARNVALGRVAQQLPLLTPFEAGLIEWGMPGEPQVEVSEALVPKFRR
ncbi:MAG: hypothetical protein IH881_11180 [Myxococcales bacterium]|nr:hypothetical protein [Myxococcales bacterium]